MTIDVVNANNGVPLGAYVESSGGGSGGDSELDKYLQGSTTDNTTTIASKDGKALKIDAPTFAVGNNLVNEINGADTQLYLKQGDVEAGTNITVEKTATGIRVNSTATGGGGTGESKYGIRGDYATHYGIIDNPNGIIEFNATNKNIVVKQGLLLNCAGNGSMRTLVSSDMPYTLESTGKITLFLANGNLLECGKVDYSVAEPEDNGVYDYQAWFNPDITVNTNQQWQFKSNDTGNVFRYVNSATPIADLNISSVGVTSVSYIGYRVIDDDVFAQLDDVENIQDSLGSLISRVNALEEQMGTTISALDDINGEVI